MALIHHKFNDPDTPLPSLVDADEELWTECVGDCLANWMQNSHEFFTNQQLKMKTVALEPFLFAVKAFLPQAWINVLVQGGVLSSDRISSLLALTEDEHYTLGLADHMFDRCALLVNNKNDIKTILNFIHDVEERPRTKDGAVDVSYAEKEVGELQIFKSLWAPIRRMYDKKKSQAKICVVYFFKIMHSQIVAYGREGLDKIDFCKDRFLYMQGKLLPGSYESFNKMGGEEYKMANNKEATACYTQAAIRNPFNQSCFGNRAQTYLNQRDSWSALWDCKRALIRDPKNSKNCYRQARACIELDWLEEALDMNEKALKHCVLEVQRVEIVKQKRLIEAQVKKRRESESESSNANESKKTPPVYNCQDSINLLSILGDGCSLYDKGQYRASLEMWAKALGIFHDLGLKRLLMSEEDLAMLKIIHALSLVKTGIFNNLMSALDKLSGLESQALVAVIYGFALVYFKLNRFNDALQQATKGLKALKEKGTSQTANCIWLSGSEIATELSTEEMEKNLLYILEESSYPPKPDAVCRSHQEGHSPRLEIYLSDPDFKGLVRVQCSFLCCVEFHLSCWKFIKATKHDNRNDKSMIDSPCPTPDCGGIIYSIQVFKPDSKNPVEITSNLKHSPSPKPPKPVIKMKTDNPKKLQKKVEKKLVRKQRKQEQKNEMVKEVEQPVEDDKTKAPAPLVSAREPKVYKGEATLLVKDDFDDILKSQGKGKSSKNKKKKEKDVGPKQTVLPLDVTFRDEGRQLFGAQDFLDEPFVDSSGLLPMPGSAPLPLGNGLLTVPSSIPYPPDALAYTLFELFEDILRAHGPQFLGSPFLQDIMKDFPDEAHKKIISYGGLYNFIYSNKKFDIIAGRFVCIREDAQKAMAIADAFFHGGNINNTPMNSGDGGGGGGFSAWAPTMPLGMMPSVGFSVPPPLPPPQQPPPKPKPAFSWEQRARDIAAKLADAPPSSTSTSSSAPAGVGHQVNGVPNIKSSIIAADELPSLHEASSSTASKRSRKKSSSYDNVAAATATTTMTTTTNTSNKNVENDDGFILITRGGGKKSSSNNSISSSSAMSDSTSSHSNNSVINSATTSARNTPSPGFSSVDGIIIPVMKTSSVAVDSCGGKSKKEVGQSGVKGMMGKTLSSLPEVKPNETGEAAKKKLKGKAGRVSGLDNFDLPTSSSSPPPLNNGGMMLNSVKNSSSVKTSSVLEVGKKSSDDGSGGGGSSSGGNAVSGKRKSKSQESNMSTSSSGGGGGSSSNSSKGGLVNLDPGRLGGGGGGVGGDGDATEDVDDNDDALSVMDSVDDLDDDNRQTVDEEEEDEDDGYSRQQLRQRYCGVGVALEVLKQQQERLSVQSTPIPKKEELVAHPPSQQPEVLSNLPILLGSGNTSTISSSKQRQQQDSGTSSPLSLSEDVGPAALRCDSPALSQGSSESSNQSQPAPLKPLKGMAGGLGILSRNKKGKQRLPAAGPNKLAPNNLLEDGHENEKDVAQKTSDLEADLSNFIYQSSLSSATAPPPPPPPPSSKEDSSRSSSSNSIIKMPSIHPQRDTDLESDSSQVAATLFNNNNAKDFVMGGIDENSIDPVVLRVFNQFSNESNTSSSFSSSFLLSSTFNNSLNQSLSTEPPLGNSSFLSGRDKHLGFSYTSEDDGTMKQIDMIKAGVEEAGDGSKKKESLNVIGMGIPGRGRKQHSHKGFVTNGAGGAIVSSPPTDFLNNEDAIKKLWSSSSGDGGGGGGDSSSSHGGGLSGYGFGKTVSKDAFVGENTLISSSSLQRLSSPSSSSTFSPPWSSDCGLPLTVPPSPLPPSTAVFPSLHTQSSSVPQPHLFDNDVVLLSAPEDDDDKFGRSYNDHYYQQQQQHQKDPFSTSSSSSSHYLSSQFGTASSSTPATSLSLSSWQQPPPSSSSLSSSSFSTNTGSALLQLNSIFKPEEMARPFTTVGVSMLPSQPPSFTIPHLPNQNVNDNMNNTMKLNNDSRNTDSPHHRFDEKERSSTPTSSSSSSSSSKINKVLLSDPTHLLPNPPPATRNNLRMLNPDVPAYTPKPSQSVFNSAGANSDPLSSPFNPDAASKDGLFENPGDLTRSHSSSFGNSSFYPNTNHPSLNDSNQLLKDGSLENQESFSSLAATPPPSLSSSSSSSRLNPNSREFRPTSSFFSALGMSPFTKETSSPPPPPPFSSGSNLATPAVAVADTSCQTETVVVETSSVAMNTVITLDMFAEMVDFIKMEARRSEDLKDELDREKAELKQAQAAECVLKRKLEESQEFQDIEKVKNEEMQRKLDMLKDELNNIEGMNEELRKHNNRIATEASTMEKERNRAVTAEKKILQISSQLMGQKLEGKKMEAAKHMAQLQNACTSFASKGVSVPPAITSKQKEWREFVTKCDRQLDSLQNFFDQQIGQLNKGRLLKDLPEVSSKINVPEMPKPPSSTDMTNSPTDDGSPNEKESSPPPGCMPLAKEDNSFTTTTTTTNAPPPGLKPLSKQLPAPLQPRLLLQQQQGGIGAIAGGGAGGGGGAASNLFLQKLSQQLPQPSMPSPPLPPSSSSSSSLLPQTPFDKIVVVLQKSFPILSREVITTFLEVVRRNNGGSFANMTVSQVVAAFRDLMLGVSPPSGAPGMQPLLSPSSLFNLDDLPSITTRANNNNANSKEVGGTNGGTLSLGLGVGGGVEEEDYDNFCPICHEDMDQSKARVLDCSHVFHEECIRRWFQQQRSCPNCREFSLLSDEFPSLK